MSNFSFRSGIIQRRVPYRRPCGDATTDILNEYAEIIERYFSAQDAEYVLTQIVLQKNVDFTVRYFDWHIMENDPDDNKFFDVPLPQMPIL